MIKYGSFYYSFQQILMLNYKFIAHVFRGQLFQDNELNSNLWQISPKTAKSLPQCDVLILFNAADSNDDAFERDTESLANAKEIVIWVVRQLKKFAPQLQIEVRFHRITNSYALYLTASYVNLLKGAELCQLKKRVKRRFGGVLRDFTFDEAQYFEGVENRDVFLSRMERALIVKRMIEMIRAPTGGLSYKLGWGGREDGICTSAEKNLPATVFGSETKRSITVVEIPEGRTFISSLAASGIVSAIFPLHDADELNALKSVWVFSRLRRQPLDAIKDYFGSEIALYFAWLEHFTVALAVPAVLGVLLFFFGGFKFTRYATHSAENQSETLENSLFSDVCFVMFALMNCVWATFYLEMWKRRQAELAFQWGNLELRSDEPLIDDPRPEFKGDSVKRNPISGNLEPQYAAWKHALIRYGITYPVTIVCITTVFVFLFAMLRLQDAVDVYFQNCPLILRWIIYLPVIFQSLIIILADNLYRYLALFFNDLENYRTDEEFESFLITKIATFQCVNAFGSLFYIAFYLNDMRRLQETLATLLISRQLMQNFVELASPMLKEKIRLFKFNYKLSRSPRSETLRRKFESFRQQSLYDRRNVDEDQQNFSNQDTKLKRILSQKSERLPLPEFSPNGNELELSEAELQSVMTAYTRPLDDYLEIFIQFGYLLLFSPAFPLAAACAILNNIFEMRVDAFKLCNSLQRPFARRVKNIGAWQSAMQIMGVVGVFVNCALIGQSGLVARLWPGLSFGGQFFIVILIEHLIFALKFAIDIAIPDVPYWVRVETAKMEHYRREAYKKDSKLGTTVGAHSTNRPYGRDDSTLQYCRFKEE